MEEDDPTPSTDARYNLSCTQAVSKIKQMQKGRREAEEQVLQIIKVFRERNRL